VSEPIVIGPGEGEIIGDSPDRRVEVLSDADELHATWSRFAAGRDGAGLHIHHRHTDLFYVLEGELTVRLGAEDEQVAISAGTLAQVPPMVVHGFRNASHADVKYLNLHAPGCGFIDYMRGLRDGTGVDFDQDEPDADGVLPASEATVGEPEILIEGGGARIALLCEVEALSVLEILMPPGGPGPERHLHRHHVESFYVAEGAVDFELDGQRALAEAGTWVQVHPDTPHTFTYPGPEPARLLILQTPDSGFAEYMRGLTSGNAEYRERALAAFDQVPVDG
jgi:mannose-6-phosphate isomerase-like protein (cupin superfamily)